MNETRSAIPNSRADFWSSGSKGPSPAIVSVAFGCCFKNVEKARRVTGRPFFSINRPACTNRQSPFFGIARSRKGNSSSGIPVRWISIFSGSQPRSTTARRSDSDLTRTSVDCVEHLHSCFSIGRLVHVDHDIGAVEGNNRWMFPRPNQRQEMHRDVAKVNVQKTRARFA